VSPPEPPIAFSLISTASTKSCVGVGTGGLAARPWRETAPASSSSSDGEPDTTSRSVLTARAETRRKRSPSDRRAHPNTPQNDDVRRRTLEAA
jgi:hypothetical protein